MVTAEEPYSGFPPCGAGYRGAIRPDLRGRGPDGFTLNGRGNPGLAPLLVALPLRRQAGASGLGARSISATGSTSCVLASPDRTGNPAAASREPPLPRARRVGRCGRRLALARGRGGILPPACLCGSGGACVVSGSGSLLGLLQGGAIDPDGLSHPLLFLSPTLTNRSDPIDEIARGFHGRWGQTLGETGEPDRPAEFQRPLRP